MTSVHLAIPIAVSPPFLATVGEQALPAACTNCGRQLGCCSSLESDPQLLAVQVWKLCTWCHARWLLNCSLPLSAPHLFKHVIKQSKPRNEEKNRHFWYGRPDCVFSLLLSFLIGATLRECHSCRRHLDSGLPRRSPALLRPEHCHSLEHR